jgi:hypothetical protein
VTPSLFRPASITGGRVEFLSTGASIAAIALAQAALGVTKGVREVCEPLAAGLRDEPYTPTNWAATSRDWPV